MSYKTELSQEEIVDLQNDINEKLSRNNYGHPFVDTTTGKINENERNKSFMMYVLNNNYSELFQESVLRHLSNDDVQCVNDSSLSGVDGVFYYEDMDTVQVCFVFAKHGADKLSIDVIQKINSLFLDVKNGNTRNMDSTINSVLEKAAEKVGQDDPLPLFYNFILATSEAIDDACDTKLIELDNKMTDASEDSFYHLFNFNLKVTSPVDLI